MNWRKTKHLEIRMQQRALTGRQINLVLAEGHECGDTLVLTDTAIEEGIRSRRQEIHDLERLRRKALTIICEGSDAITAYRNTKTKRLHQH